MWFDQKSGIILSSSPLKNPTTHVTNSHSPQVIKLLHRPRSILESHCSAYVQYSDLFHGVGRSGEYKLIRIRNEVPRVCLDRDVIGMAPLAEREVFSVALCHGGWKRCNVTEQSGLQWLI
jgi:hypothetical protein